MLNSYTGKTTEADQSTALMAVLCMYHKYIYCVGRENTDVLII